MKSSIFITINSFIGLPPVKQLVSRISVDEQIVCVQCNINSFENFFKQPKISNKTILDFKSSKAFNSQNLNHKVLKYIKLFRLFISYLFLNRASARNIYTIDLYSLLLAITFKGKATKIIYLQL